MLGCARVELLGYADSGLDGDRRAARTPSPRADVDEAAGRLAKLLAEEDADALTDVRPRRRLRPPRPRQQVHRVGTRAAELAGTPVVLEATVPRDLLPRPYGRSGRCTGSRPSSTRRRSSARSPRGAAITHRVDVRRYAVRKRVAMAAHASQATADGGDRTLAAFGRLPMPVFRQVFGHEWFVEHGRSPGRPWTTSSPRCAARPGTSR